MRWTVALPYQVLATLYERGLNRKVAEDLLLFGGEDITST
jgi:hypothetical protein